MYIYITISEVFVPLKNPMQEYFDKYFPAFAQLSVVEPHGALHLTSSENFHARHLSYPTKPTDIWVASFPKAGMEAS